MKQELADYLNGETEKLKAQQRSHVAEAKGRHAGACDACKKQEMDFIPATNPYRKSEDPVLYDVWTQAYKLAVT